MKAFLKTVLAIGLVASSSLALAEGKYAFRQPLQGVDANPTFGMSTQEIERIEAEKLAQIEQENINMCSKERLDEVEENIITNYPKEERYITSSARSYITHATNTGYTQYFWDGPLIKSEYGMTSAPNGYEIGDYKESTSCCDRINNIRRYSIIKLAYTDTETVIREEKSENYDWCVNNGYKTAN